MALVESEQLNQNEVGPGYHPPTRVYVGDSQLYRDMPHSTEALFDWPETRNETISGTHPNKVANTAVTNYSWEDNARYADPSQMSFEQCFMAEHVSWSEPEFKQSPTSSSLFSSDNDVLRPDGANLEIWMENPRTWSLDPSLEKLGEPATDETEPLEDEYQVTFCTTKDVCTRISRTPSIPSRKESPPSSPVSGTQSGKSRSKMPKCRRDSCSSSSSSRKRKPKEQARKEHAKVERRYRENLNSKIIELQQCLDRSKRNYPGYDMEFDSTVNEILGQNITRARKALHKADILTEVIRYINETDVEMRHISDELGELRSRYERLEAKCQNVTGTPYT